MTFSHYLEVIWNEITDGDVFPVFEHLVDFVPDRYAGIVFVIASHAPVKVEKLRTCCTIEPNCSILKLELTVNLIWDFLSQQGGKQNSKIEIPCC